MKTGVERSTAATTACPSCGAAVDALRAGQVAILDGKFRYFCNVDCKAAYLDSTDLRPSLEAMTAAPPPVTAAPPDVVTFSPQVEVPAVRLPNLAAQGLPFFPPLDAPVGIDVESESEFVPTSPSPALLSATLTDEAPREAEGVSPPVVSAPPTLRSVSSEEQDEPTRSQPRVGLRTTQSELPLLPAAGILLGVVSTVVPLAGDAASALRLPLALLSAAICIGVRLTTKRDDADASPGVTVGPVAVATVLSAASWFFHHPHADAHATFVGLAAAAALMQERLFLRGRLEVLALRARVAQRLELRARVMRQGEALEVSAADVNPGEQVVVEAGELVPVDGLIVSATDADVVPWLDSSSLVRKREGDSIVAGATLSSGRLVLTTTFSGAERAWLRLANMRLARIEDAAPLVRTARRFVERGSPLAALLVGIGIYASHGSLLDVAMAACAGGFGMAAASAVSLAANGHARAHALAQRHGILYRDAHAFDVAARADIAVFCSRGTVLRGEPELVVLEALGKDAPASVAEPSSTPDVDRVLAVAAGAEASFTHPFANAILRAARARQVRPDAVRSAVGHSGLGVTALSSTGESIVVGSRSLLLQEKVSVALADSRASELEAQGRSVLLVAFAGRLIGLLALQDGLRPGARAAVRKMHDAHIEPVLLSGEARETCETIASSLEIEHVRPEILPAERGAEVRALTQDGRVVAALGHASTDDGALGAADLAIAMEAAGSAPNEWGVSLASDDVRDAALALTIARSARERAWKALVIGGISQAAVAIGVAFSVAPPALVPVICVLAALAAGLDSREPKLD
jgi:Cu+-exporting ATPase